MKIALKSVQQQTTRSLMTQWIYVRIGADLTNAGHENSNMHILLYKIQERLCCKQAHADDNDDHFSNR